MRGWLTNRWLIGGLGVALLSLLIWFLGAYLGFGSVQPLASPWVRGGLIALLVAVWVALGLLRRRRAKRASSQLGAEIVNQAQAESGQAVAELRRQFDEAIAFLRQSAGRGANLYELPWYVIVGPPGSGKTTALVNSGLNFPLAQKYGKEALRGVGGTRNCDWWFTDEAVLLDTAGRYVTQDSDPTSDSAEWRQFLELLGRYRKRRPINGVLVTLSAADLLTMTPEARAGHVLAIRRRLDELQRGLHIQFPVYFLVTKCDLLAGFVEFFDDLGHDGRAQVWGMTFPEPGPGGAVAARFQQRYEDLLSRLNQRVLSRLDQEREAGRRSLIFGFPRQMAALRDNLAAFLEETFDASGFDRPVQLRGVYFTSGTQEGTPIDRVMQTLARSFGVDASAPGSFGGQGRSYFINRLLREVVFQESGLAGVNWRAEVGRAVAQNAAYLALVVAVVALVGGWFTSYRLNLDYLEDVQQTLEAHAERATEPVPVTAGLADVLPRLDALGEVAAEANRHAEDRPLLMGLGLYRGDELGEQARRAYHDGLRGLLLPRVELLLEALIRSSTRQPEALYSHLKAYLMLGRPEHLDREQLSALVGRQLKGLFAERPAVAEALALHFDVLARNVDPLGLDSLDATLVAQAQATLQEASVPVLMLSRLEDIYTERHPLALRLDQAAGLGAERVFRREQASLSDPIPALYTKAGFEEITRDVRGQLVERFLEDAWVLGEAALPRGPTARLQLADRFLDTYQARYIAYWESLLADVELVPLLGVSHATEILATLSSPTSPLKRLLQVVVEQTHFPAPEPGAAEQAASAAGGRLDQLLGLAETAQQALNRPRPGAAVSQHFGRLQRLVMAGDGAAPVDGVIGLLSQLYGELDALGGGLGEQDALALVGRSGGADVLRQVRQEAGRQPPPLDRWLTQLAGKGQQVALRSLRTDLNTRYRSQVLPACREVVAGKFPFDSNASAQVPPGDFARLFGPGGVFDQFYNEHLAGLVDTSRGNWRWKTRDGASLGIPDSVLAQFRRARTIGQTFFQQGGDMPSLAFTVTPHYLDGRARRVTLNFDGQTLVYRHGPPRPQEFRWPGDGSGVTVGFEDRSGRRPSLRYEGPWGLFRALNAGEPSAESEVRFIAGFQVEGYTARVALTFPSARNPLNRRDWTRFRCPGSL